MIELSIDYVIVTILVITSVVRLTLWSFSNDDGAGKKNAT